MRKILIAAGLLPFLAVFPALAHVRLVKAEPAAGSAVSAVPTRIRLRFNEVPRLVGTGVQLIASSGPPVLLSLSADPKDPRAIVAPLPPNLPAGRYQVRWRALSPDAHKTGGDFTFTLRP